MNRFSILLDFRIEDIIRQKKECEVSFFKQSFKSCLSSFIYRHMNI